MSVLYNRSNKHMYIYNLVDRTHKQRTTAAKSQICPSNSNEQYLNSEDNSSLNSFSYESSLIEREDHISKIRNQRQKIQKLYTKFEQQKRCIEELQCYIDELQKANRQKDHEIQQLKTRIQKQQSKANSQSGQWKETVANDKVVEIMREQRVRQEEERNRWRVEKEFMEVEWQNEKEIMKEQIEDMVAAHEDKVREFEQRWTQKETVLTAKLAKAEGKNLQLAEEIARCLKGNQERDEIEKMMAFRKELSRREKQNRIQQSDSGAHFDLSLTKQELDRLRTENNALKKDSFKLKNQLQSKQFQLELTNREKNKLQQQIVAEKEMYKEEISKLAKQLSVETMSKDTLNQSYIALTEKHERLIEEYRDLQGQLREMGSKAHRLHSLRRVEFEEIDRMGSIFSKIELNQH